MGTAVIRTRDCPEPLLARGVPDLQLYRLAVEIDGADLKVYADGADVTLRVRVIGEAEEQARFTDAGVTD